MDNNQNPYLQQFQKADGGTNQSSVQPGTLNYKPTTPETPLDPDPKNEPLFIESKVEKVSTPEISSTNIPPTPNQNNVSPTTMNVNQHQEDQSNKHIVDKTKTVAPLHHIKQAHDKLTTLADTEEEEFISEVETAHGHR